jgi:hypothetical protein
MSQKLDRLQEQYDCETDPKYELPDEDESTEDDAGPDYDLMGENFD